MIEPQHLFDPIVILLAAVVAVTVFQRIGLGSILGYLVAGVAIGPSGLALVSDVDTVATLAELGVVFLLFNVGLELPIERIRTMRALIFGLGGAQIAVTALAIAAAVLLTGDSLGAALAIGGALALSSTAIVLRLLSGRRQIATRFGRSAVAILLMQDLAVGPLLVLMVVLGQWAGAGAGAGAGSEAMGAGSEAVSIGGALVLALLKAAAAVVLILGAGRHVLPHLLRPVAALRDPEPFAAVTLLLVLGAGVATEFAGLSMGLGAFLIGMSLGDGPYRHQVAADTRPILGLLLGLFFMTVGMSIDLGRLAHGPVVIAELVMALMIGKAIVITGLARASAMSMGQALHLGVLLSQGGEFGFILLGAAMAGGVVPAAEGRQLVLVLALSMLATPLLARLGPLAARRVDGAGRGAPSADLPETSALSDHVVIAGFGRIGAALARRLQSDGQPFVAVDLDPYRVANAQAHGLPVHYGDATRPELMEALGVASARAVVVALDDPKAAVQLSALLHYIFPDLRVYARAYDAAHAEELRAAGADAIVSEAAAIGMALARLIAEAGEEKIRA